MLLLQRCVSRMAPFDLLYVVVLLRPADIYMSVPVANGIILTNAHWFIDILIIYRHI